MSRQALILAEFDPAAVPELEALGYQVSRAGWGVTRHALTERELAERMDGVSLLVVEVEEVTAGVIDAAPQLQIIATCRARPVNVDVKAATARGIPVLVTPGRNAESVADFALGLMLALARNICAADQHLRTQGWHVQGEIPYFHFRGPELKGRTLGLVGCGHIGQLLAKRALGFEMQILIYDPYLSPTDMAPWGHLASLPEVLARADFLSLHVPVTPDTQGMIGVEELAAMKPSAFLINTARAAVVDEEALYQALRKRRIAGAALDVFWQEPLPSQSRWLELDNVVLTPHLGGAADDVRVHHSTMIVEDVRALLAGGAPARLVNIEVLI